MATNNEIELIIDNEKCLINLQKLCYVLSKLTCNKVSYSDLGLIYELVKYYHLDKKEILDNINNL